MAKADAPGPLNAMAMTSVDVCALLTKAGVEHLTPSAVRKWVEAGCPRNADKTFNAFRVWAWFVNERAKIPYKAHAETDEMEKAKLEQVRERTKAIRQARLADEKKLMSREEFEQDCHRRNHMLTSGLLALSRALVREVEGKPAPEIQKVIDGRVRELLTAYSEGWDGQVAIPKDPQS